MRHSGDKGWMRYRLEYMLRDFGKEMGTEHVMSILGVGKTTVNNWLRDPHFIKAKVAYKDGAYWQWDVEKTKLWVRAIMRLDDTSREVLGIPEDYFPRGQRTPK